MFFSSVWIGDIYKQTTALTLPASTTKQMIEDEAQRLGSRALFYSATVSLAATIILPLCVTDNPELVHERWWRRKPYLSELWVMGQALFVCCMAATWYARPTFGNTRLTGMQVCYHCTVCHGYDRCSGSGRCYQSMGPILAGRSRRRRLSPSS